MRERTECYTVPKEEEFDDPVETRFLACREGLGMGYRGKIEAYLAERGKGAGNAQG